MRPYELDRVLVWLYIALVGGWLLGYFMGL